MPIEFGRFHVCVYAYMWLRVVGVCVVYIYMCVHIFISICVCTYICIYACICRKEKSGRANDREVK